MINEKHVQIDKYVNVENYGSDPPPRMMLFVWIDKRRTESKFEKETRKAHPMKRIPNEIHLMERQVDHLPT